MFQNFSKLCCKVGWCEPCSLFHKGEQRVVRCLLGLQEVVFHVHHGTNGRRGICCSGCLTISEWFSFGLFDAN